MTDPVPSGSESTVIKVEGDGIVIVSDVKTVEIALIADVAVVTLV